MYKIKGYSDEQIQYIVDNYSIMTISEIAKKLNKKPNSISYVAHKLGLLKQPHFPWTNKDRQFLHDNYMLMSSEELAIKLNRTQNSINAELSRQGLIRHKNWTCQEIKFLKENYLNMSHKEIGNVLNRSQKSITKKCFELNLYKKNSPWTQEELDFVKKNYTEMPTLDICHILHRTACSVKIKARKLGLKKYPYICDYHYFDNIDTEEKAYWLGFLTADGWISKNKKSNAGAVGIELQYGDICHLKKFNKSIGGNYKITDRWKICNLSKEKNKRFHMCSIRIFSLTMYNSLTRQGFTSEKSYHFKIPTFDEHLMRHYLRGYFDGDGCFCYTNKNLSAGFITSSLELNNDIQEILKKNNLNYSTCNYISDFQTPMYRINFTKEKYKIQFLDWIYKDSNVYLDRKYNKYLKLKNNTHSLHINCPTS